MSISRIPKLRTSVALAALLGATSLSARAAVTLPEIARAGPAVSLKHLPAGHDELVFRGESARRSWSVFIGRGEIERTRIFQVALKNAVALMPDRSSVKLSINGRLLATIPERSAEGLAVVPVAIPPGLLVPGFNTVDVSVTMVHRVDCSVSATYELWTLLDPAQTGFVLPGSSGAGLRSMADLAGEALAEDGTTRIGLRMSDVGDAAAIGRAATFVDALVARVGLVRPVVQVASDGGSGPGFDVVISTAGARDETARSLRILGREDGVTLAKDSISDRLVLILSGSDDADLDRQVSAFAAKGTNVVPPAPAGEMIVDGETRRSFASLGLPTESFAGRHYASALGVVLPGDFYPANYDRAQLLIDGSYAANLDPDSVLVFRVNGALVSSLRLGPDRGGSLHHEMVELPLRFFHPGHNEVALEAVTATPADRQCDTSSMVDDVRFTLAGTSEIAFPRFAHLGTIPQIPGVLAGVGHSGGGNAFDLYLPRADGASVGSGLTVLANMAAARRDFAGTTVHLGVPADGAAPGIVVGPFATLPGDLREAVRTRMAVVVEGGADSHPIGDDGKGPVATAEGSGDAAPQRLDVRTLVAGTQHLLKNQGFFFGTSQGPQTIPMSAHSLMVAAIDPRPQDDRLTGLNLPRFTTSNAQWLVVTAADDATLRDGLTRLVSDGQWRDLDGQAVSLDLGSGRIASVQPSRLLYVAPDHLVLSDMRPILGGLVSNHIELSLIVLMLLMAVLGVSTHALIRRMGSK